MALRFSTWLLAVWVATLLVATYASEGEVVQLEDAVSGGLKKSVKKSGPSCMGMLMSCKKALVASHGHLHKMGPAKDIMPGKKSAGHHELGDSGVTCIVMLRQCKKALISSNGHIASWGTKKTKHVLKHKIIKKSKSKGKKITKLQKLCVQMAKVSGLPMYSGKKKGKGFRGHWKKHCSGCISDGKKVAYNLMPNKCSPKYKWQRFKPQFMPLPVKGKTCRKAKGFKRTRKNDLISCIKSCTGPCKFVTYNSRKDCDTGISCNLQTSKAKPVIYKKTPTPSGFVPAAGAGQACSHKSKGFSKRQGVADLNACATLCKGSCKFVTYDTKKECDLSATCVMGAAKNSAETFQRHK